MLGRGNKAKEPAMAETLKNSIAFVGIDIGKNSFHVVGLDKSGAIVLRQNWSRGQVETRFANMPPCLIGMEACVGAHTILAFLMQRGCAIPPILTPFIPDLSPYPPPTPPDLPIS